MMRPRLSAVISFPVCCGHPRLPTASSPFRLLSENLLNCCVHGFISSFNIPLLRAPPKKSAAGKNTEKSAAASLAKGKTSSSKAKTSKADTQVEDSAAKTTKKKTAPATKAGKKKGATKESAVGKKVSEEAAVEVPEDPKKKSGSKKSKRKAKTEEELTPEIKEIQRRAEESTRELIKEQEEKAEKWAKEKGLKKAPKIVGNELDTLDRQVQTPYAMRLKGTRLARLPPVTPADVKEILVEMKVRDIVHLDLRGKCNWTEHFVIGTVEEGHPMKPIHDALYEQLRARKLVAESAGREGIPTEDWTVVDMGHIVVHLFRADTRRYYDLESLWRNAPQLDELNPVDEAEDDDLWTAVVDEEVKEYKKKKQQQQKKKEAEQKEKKEGEKAQEQPAA